jgi:hypothetical protein
MATGVEGEVARAVARRQRDRRGIGRSERAVLRVEPPDEDLVEAEVHVQDEAARRIGLDHVRVGPVVPADGEAPRRRAGGAGGTDVAGVLLHVDSPAQAAVRKDWQHRNGTSEIVRDQQEPAGRMEADVRGTGAAGRHGVEQIQLSVGAIDGERADRALLLVADAVGLVGGIEARAGGIHRQAARARTHLDDAGGSHRSRRTVHAEDVDAAAVAGRQVHLGLQHVAERRAERPHVGDEGRTGVARVR